MAPTNRSRRIRPTALVVGEGYAEEVFLKHVRALYTSNRQGCAVTIVNARGKGAANVVNHAIKFAAQADYDRIAVLLDTDTDWTQSVQARVRKAGLILLASDPCFEAVLLDIVGRARRGDSSEQKHSFQRHRGVHGRGGGAVLRLLPGRRPRRHAGPGQSARAAARR
jgi:hypothetical protein